MSYDTSRYLDLPRNSCMTFLNCYCMIVYYLFLLIYLNYYFVVLALFRFEHNWPYNKLIDKYQPRNVPLDRRLSIPLHSSQTIKQLIDLLAAQLLYNLLFVRSSYNLITNVEYFWFINLFLLIVSFIHVVKY